METDTKQKYTLNTHKEGDRIIRIYNPDGHTYCMYPYHLEKEAIQHLNSLNADTKAMSLQEAKDYIVSLYGKKDWTDLLIYELECEGKNFNDEAAELYKDSCLAAQKAELEKSITQEKAKAFDEGDEARYNFIAYSKPIFNPYRQDK